MKKIDLNSLLDSNALVTELQIRSIEPALYLLEVELEQQRFQIVDKSGKVAIHRSVEAARRFCEGLTVTRTVLVHQSAYDEMIGMPDKDRTALEMKVVVANPPSRR